MLNDHLQNLSSKTVDKLLCFALKNELQENVDEAITCHLANICSTDRCIIGIDLKSYVLRRQFSNDGTVAEKLNGNGERSCTTCDHARREALLSVPCQVSTSSGCLVVLAGSLRDVCRMLAECVGVPEQVAQRGLEGMDGLPMFFACKEKSRKKC